MTAAIMFADITLPLEGFAVLEHEAQLDGHGFLTRLRNEWTQNINRFDAPGEWLLGVYTGTQLTAVGGLNRDPYVDDARIGRLRHIYVHNNHRQRGMARRLVDELLARNTHFETIRLRTTDSIASQFYERLGFVAKIDPTATHVLATP